MEQFIEIDRYEIIEQASWEAAVETGMIGRWSMPNNLVAYYGETMDVEEI